MTSNAEKAQSIFLSAIEEHEPADWPAFVATACADDGDLRAQVERLLRAHARLGTFHEKVADNIDPTIDQAIAERPGTQIGPFKLHQEIGEGGMGIVYMALQKEPVRRKVALKIIKPGMDTREVIARFSAEKQALAIMDHPNIAKVHDAGTTASGRPYFVMELVNGVTLTQYCDDNNLTTDQRLELFVPICHAVQHAHQKGIIHRDIKPSNILVTLHDGVPVPKIIDFGIAKAINQELTTQTVATGLGQMVGTPLYMSPEQAERSGLDIDTRSDIYSLGVLLYELLTGSTPFDQEQLKDAGLDEVRRIIREQEPPRPSTRVSTMGKAATTVSEHRKTDPVELSNSLRHELDWIVMKALEKDRSRRYQTANDFARDIQRYLDDEPVEACPPSTAYRLKKFFRRHKTGVLATAGIGLALILGAGVAAGQAIRATKAEKVAEEQLQIAEEQAKLAKEQRQLAEEAAQREGKLRMEADAARKQAEAVTDYLVEAFRSPDPEEDGRTITIAEVLDRTRSDLRTRFADDLPVKAKLLAAIGTTYVGLGLPKEAVDVMKECCDLHRKILGHEHPDTLEALDVLGNALWQAGQDDESLAVCEELLRLRKHVYGLEHAKTVEAMTSLSAAYVRVRRLEEAIQMGEQALELARKVCRPDDQAIRSAMNSLGLCYKEAGQSEKALALFEQLVTLSRKALGHEHPDTLIQLLNLASVYGSPRAQDAIRLLEETLPTMRKVLGPEHPVTLTAMNNLAGAYLGVKDMTKAIAILDEVWQIRKRTLGATHRSTLITLGNLADGHGKIGEFEEAINLGQEALKLCRETYGNENHTTLVLATKLADTYLASGNNVEAATLLDETVKAKLKLLGPSHRETLNASASLFKAYLGSARYKEAVALSENLLEITRKDKGPEHPQTVSAMKRLSFACMAAGQLCRAVELNETILDATRKSAGPMDPATIQEMANLVSALAEAGWCQRAIELGEEVRQFRERTLGASHEKTLTTKRHLAACYRKVGRHEEAVRLADDVLQRCKEKLGPDAPETVNAMFELGIACAGAGQFEKVIDLLEEVAKRRRESIGVESPVTLAEMMELGRAYAGTGQRNRAMELLGNSIKAMQTRTGLTFAEQAVTFNAMTDLAKLHIEAGDYAAAEALLLEAYEGFSQRLLADPTPRHKEFTGKAITQLVDLYEKSNQPDKATAWKEKLSALTEEPKKDEGSK